MPSTQPPALALRAIEALGDPRAKPDVRWLTSLLGGSGAGVLRTLGEAGRFVHRERVLRRAHLAGGRENYAQFRAPLELYTLIRLLRPSHAVETGVSSGVSSFHLLLGLNRNRAGTLHSIDLPLVQSTPVLGARESPVAVPPGRSSGWAMPKISRARWDLRLGPSQVLLPALVEEIPRIDFFLHDDLHTPAHLAFELETIRPKLSPGAVVLADNTQWTGTAFPRFARRLGVPVRRRGRSDLVGLRVPG
ncbi:MAG: class I SAM-dependent methyltransferase [Thermoplasmata archaeon]|nr:class I SAM-dependent methyltransferase [Thermoplasmata archaeon]